MAVSYTHLDVYKRQALSGPLKGDTHRSMKIVTNGFEVNTAGVGPAPVRLSEISLSLIHI